MPPIGWFMSTLLCILLIGVPYLWVVLCFSIYNGVFFKTANRNAKLIRAEWNRSRRVLLLHFWDKRVCSRYRVWYVCYLLYLVHILLTVGNQLVLRTPSLSATLPPALVAVADPLLGMQTACMLAGFVGLLWLASSVASVIPRHKSQRKIPRRDRNPIGDVVIWAILIGFILIALVWGMWDTADILRGIH